MRILRTALPSRAALTSLCVLVWVGLLVVGWWPFNFVPRNQVTWLGGGHGIHFDGYGQVFSLPPPSPEKHRGPLTVEIWLRSAQRSFDYNEIACFGGKREKGLVIAQSGPDLVVEGNFLDRNGSFTNRRVYLPKAFASGSDRFVTITADFDRTLVYLDSTPQKSLPPLRVEDPFDGLLIGHSPSLNDPWSGDLLGLGLYRRSLSADEIVRHRDLWRAGNSAMFTEDAVALYTLDEGVGSIIHDRAGSVSPLVIPSRFYKQGDAILEHSLPLNMSELQDIVINVAGFAPFGFLLTLWAENVKRLPRASSVFWAIACGMCTSLLIELLQVYLPTRDSSLIDVLANTIGSTCGAFACVGFSAFLTRSMTNTVPVADNIGSGSMQ